MRMRDSMKHPFNFRSGDTPMRLFFDTLGFLAFLAVCFAVYRVFG